MPSSPKIEFKWNGDDFKKYVKSGATRNLTAAGVFLAREVRKVVGVSGKTITIKTSRSGKTRKVYGKQGSNPSLPGEPPHKQTGNLKSHIFNRLLNPSTERVGTTAPHGGLLEYGTRKMAARPYLRATLAKKKREIASILSRPIPDRNQ